AELNADHLLPALADSCLGAEFETPLVELARRIAGTRATGAHPRDAAPQRAIAASDRSPRRALDLTPAREGLSHRERYAKLALGDERVEVGYVATTRGCKHTCRHCPLPPAYAGSFYALPIAPIMDDVARLVARGARHVTFADPDFLNGPTHALRVAREVVRRFPGVTFDYTAKIAHLLRHDEVVDELHELGNLFVVSAVESFNDAVLAALQKGHTRADALSVVRRFRARGLTLRPTFVPFTPWETRESYTEMFDIVEGEGLVGHIEPVQYAIRLLVPERSLLLGAAEMRPHLGGFDTLTFSYAWHHPDPAMDDLQRTVARTAADLVGAGVDHDHAFLRLREAAGVTRARGPARARAGRAPRLTEDWFC
ncbi:MAG TPA: radical SAM protein, partial [Candidatus Krumholzibacteria bacterium]|nr:radical SAM protein [Candidatus Krumholzibacteria bacterium]